jgi:hypothetical protein
MAVRSIERKPPRPAGTMSNESPRSAISTDPPSASRESGDDPVHKRSGAAMVERRVVVAEEVLDSPEFELEMPPPFRADGSRRRARFPAGSSAGLGEDRASGTHSRTPALPLLACSDRRSPPRAPPPVDDELDNLRTAPANGQTAAVVDARSAILSQ